MEGFLSTLLSGRRECLYDTNRLATRDCKRLVVDNNTDTQWWLQTGDVRVICAGRQEWRAHTLLQSITVVNIFEA